MNRLESTGMDVSEFRLSHLTKNYQVNGQMHQVIEDVNLTFSSTDITVILGESGCGKTTLLRMLARLEEQSSGDITFMKNGLKDIAKVGLVFQESRLMPWLTVTENIGFHKKASREEINRYLNLMKLTKFGQAYPSELSGGMAQRVSIARALSFEPDFLLMDEPFSALDYFTRMQMQEEVIELHKTTGKGVIFVTHDLEEAVRIGTRLIVFTKNYQIKQFDLTKGETSRENLKQQILELLR